VTNFSFLLEILFSWGFIIFWRPFWRKDGSVIYCCCWTSPAQPLSSLSPAGLKTIFYCPNVFRLLQPGGSGPHIYILLEQSGPAIPPVTGFPFRRLLRLAELRWRYSNTPLHGQLQANISSRILYEVVIVVTGAHCSYKSEGHRFEARWSERIVSICLIFLTAQGPGVYSVSNKNEYLKHKINNVSGE
jgi:hypothetical protein